MVIAGVFTQPGSTADLQRLPRECLLSSGKRTTTPTKALHVIGDVNISGRLDIGTLNISGVTFSQGDLDVDNDLRVNGGANITGDFSVNKNFNVTASSGNVNEKLLLEHK